MTGSTSYGASSVDILNGSIPMHVDCSDSEEALDGEEKPFSGEKI